MMRIFALPLAASLALPCPAWPSGESLPAPPQQIFEAMLLYAEQGDLHKVGRILEKMAPLLDEIKAAYGTDLAAEARDALGEGDAWRIETALLRVVYYHMKIELAEALKAESRRPAVDVRVAYLDFLFLEPRLRRKDERLVAEAERRFRSLYGLVVSGPGRSGGKDEGPHVREIERICGLALETG